MLLTLGRKSRAVPNPSFWPRPIPTCVGTTMGAPALFAKDCGPSPRAWGLHSRNSSSVVAIRSIPTCVGTTPRRTPWLAQCTVHPHVRGDYRYGDRSLPEQDGPSPRAWGLPLMSLTEGLAIPVHPHVRGDYGGRSRRGVARTGPSPRAWGLLVRTVARHPDARSIPTCVGTTRGHTPTPWGRAVHPHVRGDYT